MNPILCLSPPPAQPPHKVKSFVPFVLCVLLSQVISSERRLNHLFFSPRSWIQSSKQTFSA